MTGCRQLCRRLGTGRWGGGAEARQVAAFIFSTPGRTHYHLLQYDRANSAFLFRRGKKNQPQTWDEDVKLRTKYLNQAPGDKASLSLGDRKDVLREERSQPRDVTAAMTGDSALANPLLPTFWKS